MASDVIPTVLLNDGTAVPHIGFGTYPMRGAQAVRAVGTAFAAGYRLIDTAAMYRNEDAVGQAMRESGLPRDAVALQTKVSGGHFGMEQLIGEIDGALGRLSLGQIDVALIHWPMPDSDSYIEQWRGLVECQRAGTVRTIGVSNFGHEQLERVIADSGVTPAVNQIELHPLKPQQHLREVHTQLGIQTQAWSPLGKERAPYDSPAVVRAAKEHNITPAQVILRWHIEIGTLPLPKSAHADRQAHNIDVFGYALTAREVAEITALGQG